MAQTTLECELAALADVERAKNLAWFFKTAKGQYGEGDRFLGIAVPVARKTALRHAHLPLEKIKRLLRSQYHEVRFAALEILVAQYERGEEAERAKILEFYLTNSSGINNWDLVDTSAPYIIGRHLLTRSRELLDKLVISENMWERRMAIVATLGLIRAGEIEDTFRIAGKLLGDGHDLIHKAVGWMLRETGKVYRADLLAFLRRNYAAMPRTALRYAIEHLPPEERRLILAGKFSVRKKSS